MSLEQLVIYVVGPALCSLIAYIMRNLMSRVESLEKQMATKLNESSVRIIVSDKLDPIKEDISEIKDSLNKLIDLYMSKK